MCFTAPPGPKPMLTISENVVSFKVFESMAEYKVLATNTGERHWSVVGWILACTLSYKTSPYKSTISSS